MVKGSEHMRVSKNFKRYVRDVSKSTGKSAVDITDELADGGVQVNIVIQKKNKHRRRSMFDLGL